jgi:lipopolysaccharide/colanic/teichoic acid biosynthesis glycosyltransferase
MFFPNCTAEATSSPAVALPEPPRFVTIPKRRLYQRVLKRAFDVLGSGVMILILSPLLIVLPVVIILRDGFPVIHRRRVIGSKGDFDAYKFRTMHVNADAILAADPALQAAFARNFKLKDDPRVSRLGGKLRKYSLDELPQLFNVLKGEMSLVGPRMITASELEKYGPCQKLLLTVKPGLTGYWQVQGRQNLSYDERVRMDVYYVEHWSIGLDLMILLRTPLRVIRGDGAY